MKISIITPTFNEIENIEKLYLEIKNEFEAIAGIVEQSGTWEETK